MPPKGKPKALATQTPPKPLSNTKHGQNLSTGGNDNRNNITVVEKVGIGCSSTVTTTQAPLSSVSSNPASTSSPQPTSIDIAEIESKCFYASDDSNKAVRGSGSSASTVDGHSTDIEIPRTGSPFNETLARGIQPSFGQKGHRTTIMKAQTREELASMREGISRGQDTARSYDYSTQSHPRTAWKRPSGSMVAHRAVNDTRQGFVKNAHIFSAIDYGKPSETKKRASASQISSLNKAEDDEEVEGGIFAGLPLPTQSQAAVERLWKGRYLLVTVIIIGFLYYTAFAKA